MTETEAAAPAEVEAPKAKKMTATELREVKNLIKQDFKVLGRELDRRRNTLDNAVHDEMRAEQEAAVEELKKAFAPLQKAVDTLNERIVKVVEGLAAKGFVIQPSTRSRDGSVTAAIPIDPEKFKVKINSEQYFRLYRSDPVEFTSAISQIEREYRAAWRDLERTELELTRDVVEDFVTSMDAVRHLRALPQVTDLLAIPTAIEGVDLNALEY